MATLNLGRIKPVFRGAYAGGTAYVVDDIVTSGNETFICILASTGNATSNATYWTKLAAKGTDGTDVGTTITTQGDVLYRDGSGLQRLAKGTASQQLAMNAGATAPEWVTVAGGSILQVKSAQTGSYYTTTNGNNGITAYDVGDLTITMTPTAASSHFLVTGQLMVGHDGSYVGRGFITYNHSGITETAIISNQIATYGYTIRIESSSDNASSPGGNSSVNIHFAPNTTNALTLKFRMMSSNSGHPVFINNTESNHNNSDDGGCGISSLTLWEIAGGITPAVANTTIAT